MATADNAHQTIQGGQLVVTSLQQDPQQSTSATEAAIHSIENGDQSAGELTLDVSGGLTQDGMILKSEETSAPQFILANVGDNQMNDNSGTLVTDSATLQAFLSSHGGAQLTDASGQTIQIIQLGNNTEVDKNGRVWQLVQGGNDSQMVAIQVGQDGSQDDSVAESGDNTDEGGEMAVAGGVEPHDFILVQPHVLPENCPGWAARLRDCEQIGDYYRGWVEDEVELELTLTYHKQQTGSMWGTRQAPNTQKASTRLMWKSQYAPFDGVPFINSGSRAIVMECQYGPRRKGAVVKKENSKYVVVGAGFKQTCPARIYIKKVIKFTEYAVSIVQDRKMLKIQMDNAFQLLREKGVENTELKKQERYYVQLPTEAAHEFHTETREPTTHTRIHPDVVKKIRSMVSGGEKRLYAIRKQLRKYVESELFNGPDCVPEKHNLCYYPTVNALQNQIHQALKDIENGTLQFTGPVVTKDNSSSHTEDPKLQQSVLYHTLKNSDPQPSGDSSKVHAETVTVTLTQNPTGDGQHIISRVETHLSDGSTRVSDSLTPETAKLLAKLHPNMFSEDTLVQLSQMDEAIEQQQQVIHIQGGGIDQSATVQLGQPSSVDQSAAAVTENAAAAAQLGQHQVLQVQMEGSDQGQIGQLLLTEGNQVTTDSALHTFVPTTELLVPKAEVETDQSHVDTSLISFNNQSDMVISGIQSHVLGEQALMTSAGGAVVETRDLSVSEDGVSSGDGLQVANGEDLELEDMSMEVQDARLMMVAEDEEDTPLTEVDEAES